MIDQHNITRHHPSTKKGLNIIMTLYVGHIPGPAPVRAGYIDLIIKIFVYWSLHLVHWSGLLISMTQRAF